MKLSIITINYNNAEGLKKTLESVGSQTVQPYEYIVIDGGSSDASVQYIKQYSDNLTYWCSEKDSGIYNAMNKGLSVASGDYCLFLNSGDILYNENTIKNMIETHPVSDIVSFCCLEDYKKYHILHKPPKRITFYSVFHSSLSHPSTLIKTELIKRIGGYHEQYRIMSDWCFFVEALIDNNASYEFHDIITAIFDTTGISSTNQLDELNEAKLFLKSKYPRIYQDYILFNRDEPTFNVLLWAQSHPRLNNCIRLINRILNRIFCLRNKLGIRLRIEKFKRGSEFE